MDSVTQIALGASIAGACVPNAQRGRAMLAGAALGTLALTTRRVREAIVAHTLHNAIGLWLIWPAAGPAGP